MPHIFHIDISFMKVGLRKGVYDKGSMTKGQVILSLKLYSLTLMYAQTTKNRIQKCFLSGD